MKEKFKIDLHTHSILSHDGGIFDSAYVELIDSEILNLVAITDHNEIDLAVELSKARPGRIIVGEEIRTKMGDIIGLFIEELIPRGLTPLDTVREIKEQNGLVYIPHPFDTRRGGLGKVIYEISEHIDIIEGFNARSFSKSATKKSKKCAKELNLPWMAGSDAHNLNEIGTTYTILDELPDRDSLIPLLNNANSEGRFTSEKRVNYIGIFNPKLNKLRKIRKHG